MPEPSSDPRRLSSSSSSSHDASSPPVATNVQVAVRCRPLNSREKASGRGAVVQCKPNSSEVAIIKRKTYTFDRVFSQYSTQKDVFTSVVKPAVDEALAGYNCTVFAYGQTGTGKTYTMQGDLSPTSDMAGIIPRSVCSIFDALEARKDEFSVRVSFLQLYNEELKDLLDPETDKKLRLMEDTKRGGIYCMNLLEVTATTAKHVYELVETGVKNRITSETLMNENSSRSHSIFTIRIHSKEHNTAGEDLLRVGQLNLVDLAGSECVGRSGARNARAREAGTINQSLLTLGRVITALVDNLPHVPYRDSKLTRLLQESLGGRAKTTIIATLAPCADSLDETLSTLEYAFRAKHIKNKPQVNQKMTKAGLLNEFESEIEMLRAALHAARVKDGVYLPLEQFTDMQERLGGQAVQLTELEDILKERNRSCQELEEMAKRHADDVMALKAEKQTVSDRLVEVQEELFKTQEALETKMFQLQQVQSLVKAFQDNEQVLLANGATATQLYRASEERAAQLVAKLETRQVVEETNSELATSFHSDSKLKLDAFLKRIANHKETQETLFQDAASALQELQTAHSLNLDAFLTHLNAMQDLVEAQRCQTAESRAKDEEETLKQRKEVNISMQKQQKSVENQLETLVEQTKSHVYAILEDLKTSKARNLSLLENLQSTLERSRQEVATFFIDHSEKLQQLQTTINSSLIKQGKELEGSKMKLTSALQNCQNQHEKELLDMKKHLAHYIEKCIESHIQHHDEQRVLIEQNVEKHQKTLENVQLRTKQEIEFLVQEMEKQNATQEKETTGLGDQFLGVKNHVNESIERQLELVQTQEQVETLWTEETRKVTLKQSFEMKELLEKHVEKDTARLNKRHEELMQFFKQHDECGELITGKCQTLAEGLRSRILKTEDKVDVLSTFGKTILGEAKAASSQQLQDMETYMKKRKIIAITGDTPVKALNRSFPSFESTQVSVEQLNAVKTSLTTPINASSGHKRRRLSDEKLVDRDQTCTAVNSKKQGEDTVIVEAESNTLDALADTSLVLATDARFGAGEDAKGRIQNTPVTPSKLKKTALLGFQKQKFATAHANRSIKVSSASAASRKTKASALAVPKRYRAKSPPGESSDFTM